MKRLIIFFLVLPFLASAQNIQLTFKDKNSLEVLPYVTVSINGVAYGSADKKGIITLPDLKGINSIGITNIGYKTISLLPEEIPSDHIVFLEPVLYDLSEITVRNRAIEIVKEVIENKKFNQPYRTPFEVYAYTKVLFNLKFAQVTDSLLHREKTGTTNDYISEIVSKLTYRRVGGLSEKVITFRNAGFEKTFFSFPVSSLQPFNFYESEVKIGDNYYLNPISMSGLNRYRYILEQTDVQENDTTYLVHFSPKSEGYTDLMEGIMHIDHHSKAIKEIYARPPVTEIAITEVKQTFAHYEETGWFPSKLNYLMSIMPNDSTGIEMRLETYLNSPENVLEETLGLNEMREEYFTHDDEKTYQVIDSVFKENKVELRLNNTLKLLDGFLPLKKVDVDLTKVIDFNLYEKFRLGLGLQTGNNVSDIWSVNGYFGYGFGDKKMKYGLGGKVNLADNTYLSAMYMDDIREIGTNANHDFRSQRAWVGNYFDQIKGGLLGFNTELNSFLSGSLNMSHFRMVPGYPYGFDGLNTYTNTEVGADIVLGLSRTSDFVLLGRRLQTDVGKPTLKLSWRRGLQGVLDSDFNYNKLLLDFSQSFYTKHLGTTSYSLDMGWLDKPLPIGLMFTGMGVGEPGNILFMDKYFQTMAPNEFISDQFANLFFNHNFHNKIIRWKGFNPDLVIHHNMGMAGLKTIAEHSNFIPEANHKLYLESGLVLDKLMKVNYFNLFDLSIGAGLFYRYGDYSLGSFGKNLFPKISISFSN